jgi:hypothetical protein
LNCVATTGDGLRIQISPFSTTPAGIFGGFTMDGSGASAGVAGVHFGDIVGATWNPTIVQNFSGAGSKGWWLDNRTNWTEENVFVNCASLINTIGLLFDVNGGANSFGYNTFVHFRVQVNAGQTGVQSQSSAHVYSGQMQVRGNSGGAGSWIVQVLGTSLMGGTGGAGGPELFDIKVETTGVGAPGGLNIAVGAQMCGIGNIDLSIGGSTSANAGSQNIQFAGYFNCPGIFGILGEAMATNGLSVLLAPNYPTGPGIWSDNNSIFLFSKVASAITLRPNGPASASNQFSGQGGVWQSSDGSGVARNSLDDGAGNIIARAQVQSGARLMSARATPAYSASITPDASNSNWQTITVTNVTAFTINAPTNPPGAGQTETLTVEIFNNSGGAMGAITFNAVFILVGGAFTNPATGKHRSITFGWNGTNWVELTRAGADY